MGGPEIVLITGCATGIGRALAQNLHQRRLAGGDAAFKVYGTDYRLDALSELAGLGISTLQLDVTQNESVNSAVTQILKAEGRIDMLICNAGIAAGSWLIDTEAEDMQRVFDVNVFGVFKVIKAVGAQMMERRAGKIAIVCSVNAWVVNPFRGIYCGSKAAMAAMSEVLRMEVEPLNISVTTINPGMVRTDILPNSLTRLDRLQHPSCFYHRLTKGLMARRANISQKGTSPQEAAEAIAKALAVLKPRRSVIVGEQAYLGLLLGFIQTWISPWLVAKYMQRVTGLNQPQLLGRATDQLARDWKHSKQHN